MKIEIENALISEQVKELRELQELMVKLGGDCAVQSRKINYAVDTIESLYAKLQAANDGGGWIPCSERMPEPFDNVLVSTKGGGRAIAHRCPNQAYGKYYDLHSSDIENVIAWQPLPKPYHEH